MSSPLCRRSSPRLWPLQVREMPPPLPWRSAEQRSSRGGRRARADRLNRFADLRGQRPRREEHRGVHRAAAEPRPRLPRHPSSRRPALLLGGRPTEPSPADAPAPAPSPSASSTAAVPAPAVPTPAAPSTAAAPSGAGEQESTSAGKRPLVSTSLFDRRRRSAPKVANPAPTEPAPTAPVAETAAPATTAAPTSPAAPAAPTTPSVSVPTPEPPPEEELASPSRGSNPWTMIRSPRRRRSPRSMRTTSRRATPPPRPAGTGSAPTASVGADRERAREHRRLRRPLRQDGVPPDRGRRRPPHGRTEEQGDRSTRAHRPLITRPGGSRSPRGDGHSAFRGDRGGARAGGELRAERVHRLGARSRPHRARDRADRGPSRLCAPPGRIRLPAGAHGRAPARAEHRIPPGARPTRHPERPGGTPPAARGTDDVRRGRSARGLLRTGPVGPTQPTGRWIPVPPVPRSATGPARRTRPTAAAPARSARRRDRPRGRCRRTTDSTPPPPPQAGTQSLALPGLVCGNGTRTPGTRGVPGLPRPLQGPTRTVARPPWERSGPPTASASSGPHRDPRPSAPGLRVSAQDVPS